MPNSHKETPLLKGNITREISNYISRHYAAKHTAYTSQTLQELGT